MNAVTKDNRVWMGRQGRTGLREVQVSRVSVDRWVQQVSLVSEVNQDCVVLTDRPDRVAMWGHRD